MAIHSNGSGSLPATIILTWAFKESVAAVLAAFENHLAAIGATSGRMHAAER